MSLVYTMRRSWPIAEGRAVPFYEIYKGCRLGLAQRLQRAGLVIMFIDSRRIVYLGPITYERMIQTPDTQTDLSKRVSGL
jgi:hypothetical protein